MSVQELKLEVIQMILEINDLGVIEQMKKIANNAGSKKRTIPIEKEETTDQFIEEMIVKGKEDFANGNTYAQAEVKQKIQEWQVSKK